MPAPEKTVSEKETAIELLKRIAALEKQSAANAGRANREAARADRAEAKVQSLTDELAMVRAQQSGDSKPAPVDGFYTWGDFFSAVFASLDGRMNRWQTDFSEQTGVPLSTVQKWRQQGKVPATNYEMATMLTPKSSAPQPRRAWTDDEYDILKALLNSPDKPTYATIAATLSEQFGRKITENAIKGAVNRMKGQ